MRRLQVALVSLNLEVTVFRAFIIAFLYALLTVAGCTSKPDTKVVDRPDTAPMELPAIGWATTFVATQDGSTVDEPVVGEPTEFDVYLKQHATGAAVDYGGFLIYVSSDVFSFNTKKYWVYSWYYGYIEITVEGAGDAVGAYIFVRGDYDGGWYTLMFELEHNADLGVPSGEPAFAGRDLPRLPLTPDDLVALR